MAIDPGPFDELVDEYLVDCQRRADAGEPLTDTAPAAGPVEVRERLERGRACVELLAAIKRGDSAPPVPMLKKLGRFEILSELGVGGFGIVFRARDPRTDRDVALKIPRIESLGSDEHRLRFEQEARAAARLDHPYVAAVLEADMADGLPYIASTYYRGVTLSRWLKERPRTVPPRHAAELVRKLADAVEHAHEHGVLHRDIKPGNIMLATSDSELLISNDLSRAVPKLMDFGLAKLIEQNENMTRTGALVGTVRYMSPEQAMGRTKEIGPGADIYSLGAVLYELLSGRPPFSGDTDWEVLRKIERQEATRISHARGSAVADLETICLKCLEKQPARRYASARLLADDLQRYLNGSPIRARRVTSVERLTKWARRNPAWAGFFGFASVAGLMLIGTLAWSNWRVAGALRSSREYAYGADLRLAQDAWEQSSPAEARRYLSHYVAPPGEDDLRGVEWHHLWDLMGRDSQVVARQDSEIWSMAVSPDTRRIATGDRHGVIRLWNRLAPGEPIELIVPTAGNIDGLVFTPDGKRLISCGDDRSIRIWDVATHQLLHELKEHTGWVGAIAISHDGRWLASGDGTGRVLLWDLQTAQLARELARHPRAIRWLAMHPTRPWLASASEGGELQLWDYETNAPPAGLDDARLESPIEPSWRNAVWAPYDNLLAPNRNEIWEWDLMRADQGVVEVRRFPSPDKVMSLAVLGQTKMLVEGGSDTYPDVRLRRHATGRPIEQTLHGHSDAVRCVVGLGPTSFVSGSEDGTVRQWTIGGMDHAGIELPLTSQPLSLAWTPGEDTLVVGLRDGDVIAIDRRTQKQVKPLGRLAGPVTLLAFGPQKDRLVASDQAGHLVWISLTGQPVAPICDLKLPPDRLTISRDGRWLAYSHKQRIGVIDLRTGREQAHFDHAEGVWACAFLDGRNLIAGDMRGDVRCYDVVEKRLAQTLSGHRNSLNWATLSPDGEWLATAAADKTVHVYDADSLKLVQSIAVRDALDGVYILDDHRLFVDGGGMIGILNMRTGQTILDWPLEGTAVPTHDGRAIAMLAERRLRLIDLDYADSHAADTSAQIRDGNSAER